MLKLKNSDLRTSITQVERNMLKTQGFSQEEIIGNFSFPEMVYLLLKGEKPSGNHEKMFEAVLVSFCDHGITPPSTISKIMASAGSPVNVCIAGGILAFGENHAGAIENAMKIFQEGVKISDAYNDLHQKLHGSSLRNIETKVKRYPDLDIVIIQKIQGHENS
ncbi:citrate/2-methylcitrate synthase [Methanobacterium sp. SMA-27]|uniref:citrate/2-methylcitrate synthase n=1 Tax=Methanobacterium sp. SMA-27 TaxID=1495336 RepID=UPI002100F51C|nr:citrate/2-methylcitrate synthase [Methanobacterium sp. SMA-27]